MSKTSKFRINLEFNATELAVVIISILTLFSCLFYVLFAFTPLHDIIPGYPTKEVQLRQMETAMRIDSLERSIRRWELYSENLRNIVAGKPARSMESIVSQVDSEFVAATPAELAKADSSLRSSVAALESVKLPDRNKMQTDMEGLHFFQPVSGVVSASFDNALHPYIEISAPEGSPVKAVLDGSVIYSEWSENYGWSIILQHGNGILSIYRNNLKLLKNVGDKVGAGASIALLGGGNSDSGSCLVFELWHDGAPVDPVIYMNY